MRAVVACVQYDEVEVKVSDSLRPQGLRVHGNLQARILE